MGENQTDPQTVKANEMSWNSIEALPKDDREVFARGHSGSFFVVRYNQGLWFRSNGLRIVGLTHWMYPPPLEEADEGLFEDRYHLEDE